MLSGNPTVFGIDPYTISSTPIHPLGAKGISVDGRIFRYAKAGATALAPGKLTVAADITANHEDIAFATAGVIGDRSVSITLGATAVTASEYAGGYLVIIDDTGEGHTHLIESHDVADASTACTFNIKPGLLEATTTSTTVALVRNPYYGLVISATNQADVPTGIPQISITASYYGWVQTGGVCGAFMDESCAHGANLTIGTGASGALEVIDLLGEKSVAYAMAGVNATDTEYNPVYLTLD